MHTNVLRKPDKPNPPVWLDPDRHDHWAAEKPSHVSQRDWNYFGDHYPGSHCRWLTNDPRGQERAQQLLDDHIDELWIRVRRSERLMHDLESQ